MSTTAANRASITETGAMSRRDRWEDMTNPRGITSYNPIPFYASPVQQTRYLSEEVAVPGIGCTDRRRPIALYSDRINNDRMWGMATRFVIRVARVPRV